MKKLYVLLSLIISCAFNAQTWIWDTLENYTNVERLSKDKFQHIYSFPYDGSQIRKYTTAGVLLWQQNYPTNLHIHSIKCADDSTIYVAGLFEYTLNIGNNSLVSRGDNDICLARLSPNGSLLWIKQAGSKKDERRADIGFLSNKVYIIGTAQDTLYFTNTMRPKPLGDEFFIARYSTAGVFDTVKFASQFPLQYPGNGTYGVEIEGDLGGNLVFLYTEFDPYASYLTKLDTALMPVWQNTIGGYTDYEHCLKINALNQILYVESWDYFGSGADSEFSKLFLISAGGSTVAVYPHNRKGHIFDYDLDSCNNVYFAGYGRNSSYALIPKYYLTTGHLSPNLNLGWRREDSANVYRGGFGVVSLSPNKCFVAGAFSSSLALSNNLNVPANTSGYFHAVIQATFGLPTNVTPSNNLFTCASSSVSLSCSTGGVISWYSSPTSQTPLHTGSTYTAPPLSAGIYTYYAQATTCSMTTGRLPVTVTVNALPTISVNTGSICANQNFTIVPSGAISYTFPGGSPVVSPPVTSVYSVSGTDANGCSNTATCQVNVMTGPPISISSTTNSLCRGESATITCSGAQSYSFNLQGFSGSTVINPTITTTYVFAGSIGQGCTSSQLYTQMVVTCLSTGLNDFTSDSFKIYPNPGDGNFMLELTNPAIIKITDTQGRLLIQKNVMTNEKIDLSDQPKGIYFLKISGNNHETVKKIVVQ